MGGTMHDPGTVLPHGAGGAWKGGQLGDTAGNVLVGGTTQALLALGLQQAAEVEAGGCHLTPCHLHHPR